MTWPEEDANQRRRPNNNVTSSFTAFKPQKLIYAPELKYCT